MPSGMIKAGKKRIIFNLPLSLIKDLQSIPAGQRSRMAEIALEREVRIAKRVKAVKAFHTLHGPVKVKRDKSGWGDVTYDRY